MRFGNECGQKDLTFQTDREGGRGAAERSALWATGEVSLGGESGEKWERTYSL